jgi:O-antigen/teichoic acid export membrane protein
MTSSLQEMTIKASSWTILGYGLGQIVRFIGHLIVARILIPADFGLMQLVYVFIQGLHMFSDLGLGPNVIQHHKGEESDFLTTAWTVQILRGVILWLMTFVIAYPVAYIYEAPQLAWLLPVAGLGIFIDSFASINLIVMNRKMEMKKLAWIETLVQCVGVIAMVVCALKWHSVWALVIASLTTALLKTILSYYVVPGVKMHLNWHKEYAWEIIHFGKWIFLGSIIGFFVTKLDRLILGLYLSKTDLGLYGIAAGIVLLILEVANMLTSKVLLPIYAHLKNQSSENFEKKIGHVRMLTMLLVLPPLFILAIWGQQIVNLLYTPIYAQAGWIIQILAIGGCFKVITLTLMPLLIAVGDSFRMMCVQATQSVILIILLVIGGYYFGIFGLIVASAFSDVFNYPILIIAIKKYNIWEPKLDFTAAIISIAVIAMGFYLFN